MRGDFYSVVEKLILNQKEEIVVTPELRFKEDLGADSVQAMEFILALEDEYGIEIADEDADNFNTVSDVLVYLENHIK